MAAPAEEIVLDTKWFQIIARHPPGYTGPHYSLRTLDYVCIVAVNREGELLLVRQSRPAIGQTTLEIPSGHVEPGQTPEQAARAELLEETGHEAERFDFLTKLSPDTGRFTNRMWCFFAGNVAPTRNPGHQTEANIELIFHRGTIKDLVMDRSFCSALHCAALFAAVLQGKIKA